jgi:hypothetical protein
MALNQGKFTTTTDLVLNEKVLEGDKNVFKELGKVALPVPSLSDFGLDVEVKVEDGQPVSEDGMPVYVDDTMNWLQSAIINQVKAQSRNKFVKGELKDGQKLAETFAELIAVGERTGEALKARHEARKSFAAYLEAANKKATVVKLLSDLFGDEKAIATAKDDFIDALGVHIPKWIAGLTESDKVRYANKVASLQEAINARSFTADDFK